MILMQNSKYGYAYERQAVQEQQYQKARHSFAHNTTKAQKVPSQCIFSDANTFPRYTAARAEP